MRFSPIERETVEAELRPRRGDSVAKFLCKKACFSTEGVFLLMRKLKISKNPKNPENPENPKNPGNLENPEKTEKNGNRINFRNKKLSYYISEVDHPFC